MPLKIEEFIILIQTTIVIRGMTDGITNILTQAQIAIVNKRQTDGK